MRGVILRDTRNASGFIQRRQYDRRSEAVVRGDGLDRVTRGFGPVLGRCDVEKAVVLVDWTVGYQRRHRVNETVISADCVCRVSSVSCCVVAWIHCDGQMGDCESEAKSVATRLLDVGQY